MSRDMGRVVRAPGAASAPLWSLEPTPERWRRIARDEVEARSRAAALLDEARREGEAILAAARKVAATAAEQALIDARDAGRAEAAAEWISLRRGEEERIDREADRVLAIAVALAERLLGAELELAPHRIADLARTAMAEAHGARRIALDAHPLDAETLRHTLLHAGLGALSVDVRSDEGLARGELRLQTDVGTIDAKLSARLERLAAALRDALP